MAYIPRTNRHLLLGFIRLRLSTTLEEHSVLPELVGKTAMIRELHVYGNVSPVGSGVTASAQHLGIGKKLLAAAETLAYYEGYGKVAVISGIGVRDYYRKRGYELVGTYMIKSVQVPIMITTIYWLFLICAILRIISLV
jgi:elongator complex protein 3